MPSHRDFSGGSSETTVTLPSFRDIFPEFAGKSYPFSNRARASFSNEIDNRSVTCGPHSCRNRAPSPSRCSSNRRSSDPSPHIRAPESSQNDGHVFRNPSSSSPPPLQQQPPAPPSEVRVNHHHTRSLPPFPTASQRHQARTDSFSFDVLKSDPDTTSQEHVASSTTLRTGSAKVSRGMTTDERKGFQAGSAPPAFRVSLMERLGADDPMSQDGDQNWKRAADLDQHHSHPPPTTGTPPALIQFSLATTVVSSASSTSSSESRRNHTNKKHDVGAPGSSSLGRDKGKKHECPHCSKRFNRPSSLRIHVNTHTGLKPFECPFLHCGRLFNVNSNMRRHYRNHVHVGISPPGTHQDGQGLHGSAPSEHALPFEFGWRHEDPSGALWKSLEDVDGSEEEMDELQDEDDPEHPAQLYTPESTPSPQPTTSRSFYLSGRNDPSAAYLYHGSPRAGYNKYAPSSSIVSSHSCKDLNVSTTLRPAFPLRSRPHDRLNRN